MLGRLSLCRNLGRTVAVGPFASQTRVARVPVWRWDAPMGKSTRYRRHTGHLPAPDEKWRSPAKGPKYRGTKEPGQSHHGVCTFPPTNISVVSIAKVK